MKYAGRKFSFLMIKLAGFIPIIVASYLLPAAVLADTTPPRIVHDIVSTEIAASKPFEITATVTDSDGVSDVVLFYKNQNASEFKSLRMNAESENGRYSASIPSDDIGEPGIDYFITATDTSGNQQFRGFDFDPLQITVFAPLALTGNDEAAPASSGGNRTLWYVVGAAVVAGVALSQGGSDGGGSAPPSTTFVFER